MEAEIALGETCAAQGLNRPGLREEEAEFARLAQVVAA
jgi:hypothetical protein